LNRRPPPVVIERVLADGVPLTFAAPIHVRPGAKAIEVEYTALSLIVPPRVRFKVRLDGFDSHWVDVGTRRTAYYTNLPPGSYRFRAIASNDDGIWNDSGAAADIVLEPRFFQTGWFVVLCSALGVAALFLAYRIRVGVLRRRQRALERLVLERTRELRAAQADLVRAERMASVATLVRGIAHELNNPIGFLAGNIEPLRRYGRFLAQAAERAAGSAQENAPSPLLAPGKDVAFVAGDLDRMLDDIAEGARRAQLIISDLQGLTAAPKRGLDRVDLAKVVRQTLALLGPKLHERVRVELDLADLPPLPARAGQVEQLLVNLLDNALQAVGGEGTISVRTSREGDFVRLSIRDDGCGMSEEVRARACEPFFTTRGPGEGSGLGLAIVAAIVAEHRGTMEIRSQPGQGTEVVVRIPAADGA
jgi:signal transduction histidine kinase